MDTSSDTWLLFGLWRLRHGDCGGGLDGRGCVGVIVDRKGMFCGWDWSDIVCQKKYVVARRRNCVCRMGQLLGGSTGLSCEVVG